MKLMWIFFCLFKFEKKKGFGKVIWLKQCWVIFGVLFLGCVMVWDCFNVWSVWYFVWYIGYLLNGSQCLFNKGILV